MLAASLSGLGSYLIAEVEVDLDVRVRSWTRD